MPPSDTTKKRIILPKLLFSVYTILAALWIVSSIFYVPFCPGCERGAANSNAKLTFTNANTYLTKCSVKTKGTMPDGIYCGGLKTKKNKEYSPLWNYTASDLDTALKYLMGSPSTHAGYYCVIIKNGEPLACYYSSTGEWISLAPRLAAAAEADHPWTGSKTAGVTVGGYPVSCYSPDPPPLTESVSPLPLYYEGGTVPHSRLKAEAFIFNASEYLELLFSPDIGGFAFMLYLAILIILLIRKIASKRKE